ncbi:tetratricopeptide repeat protein [uncultured Clostridium sp.]|uniref:tetratricopeptide repeat protein n=1 Tax=uncultured Clostridium sp. TaxID=59620 RepID=UPI0025E5376C|nr:tetratricopeptide repeat protein [uncultured Clostridium sp.]
MKTTLNKTNIILISIILLSLISSTFLGMKLAILLCLLLFLIYLIITKHYFIKVYKGMKAYKIENYSNALENYRDAALSKYCNGPIISNYLICELKYGKPSIAREYIDENLISKNIKSNEKLNLEVTKAIVLWKTNSQEKAINLLKHLIENNKNTYIYETLTSLLLASGKFNEAKKYISEAMEFNSDNNIIKSNYAELCFKFEQFDEAEKTFDYLINENVKFIEPYYYSALLERKKGNCDKAFELLRIAESFNESLVSLITHKDIEQALNSVLIKSLNMN